MIRLSTSYLVNEVFHSIQGEASWTGTASVFVRLQGCDVGCPWCDTRQTWEVEDSNCIPAGMLFSKEEEAPTWGCISSDDLILWCKEKAPRTRHIVLTGGEPLMQDVTELIMRLYAGGFTVQVETSGTEPVASLRDNVWVTLSPKIAMPGKKEVLQEAFIRADEVKFPISGNESEEARVLRIMDIMALVQSKAPLYLQPLSKGKVATQNCINLALKYGLRVSIQTHKYVGVR